MVGFEPLISLCFLLFVSFVFVVLFIFFPYLFWVICFFLSIPFIFLCCSFDLFFVYSWLLWGLKQTQLTFHCLVGINALPFRVQKRYHCSGPFILSSSCCHYPIYHIYTHREPPKNVLFCFQLSSISPRTQQENESLLY